MFWLQCFDSYSNSYLGTDMAELYIDSKKLIKNNKKKLLLKNPPNKFPKRLL